MTGYWGKAERGISLGAKALAVAYGLKKLINVEKKTCDSQVSGTQGNTGAIQNVTACAQGDDYNNRQGRSVRAVSLEWQGNISQHASATSSQYRIVVFIDKNNQGVIPSATDLMTTDVFSSLRDGRPDNLSRYRILSDEMYVLDHDAMGTTLQVNGFRRLNHHVKFSGTDAADASAGQGSVWVYTVSNEATNVISHLLNFRFRYIDN